MLVNTFQLNILAERLSSSNVILAVLFQCLVCDETFCL